MTMRKIFLCFALLPVVAVSGQTPAVAEDPVHSPYGVCAHLPGEGLVPPRLEMMGQAGIRWVRSDFTWRGEGVPRVSSHLRVPGRFADEIHVPKGLVAQRHYLRFTL